MIKKTTKIIVTETTTRYEVDIPGADQGAKLMTVGEQNGKPFIRMTGKWLENAGFHIGDKIQVTEKENQLVLERLVESSQGSSEGSSQEE